MYFSFKCSRAALAATLTLHSGLPNNKKLTLASIRNSAPIFISTIIQDLHILVLYCWQELCPFQFLVPNWERSRSIDWLCWGYMVFFIRLIQEFSCIVTCYYRGQQTKKILAKKILCKEKDAKKAKKNIGNKTE